MISRRVGVCSVLRLAKDGGIGICHCSFLIWETTLFSARPANMKRPGVGSKRALRAGYGCHGLLRVLPYQPGNLTTFVTYRENPLSDLNFFAVAHRGRHRRLEGALMVT